MAGTSRQFRTDDSIKAEEVTRSAIPGFLARRGFTDIIDDRTKAGTAVSQIVRARDPGGVSLKMHVRLCWRRGGSRAPGHHYSAAQLRARLTRNDWDETLRSIVERDQVKGVTHTLFVQPDRSKFVLAALVPLNDLIPIWREQFRVSAELIAQGRAGRRTTNHVTNGSSPTIWLQDDTTHEGHVVADVLWNWPRVIDLAKLEPANDGADETDSIDDLGGDRQLGRDAGVKVAQARSGYPRDPQVRAAVLSRAGGRCERDGCGQRREFKGFLDVHHILGIGRSDRPWSCVALCPNCHREAHFAPDREAINATLAAYAARFA